MGDLKPRTVYGWRRDSLDARDLRLSPPRDGAWPSKLSLRSKMPAVYDQGQLGSCTANALAGAVEYQESMQSEGQATPSRLFIYYYERFLEGTVDQDSGAEIRDGAKVIATYGAPPETDWPYSDANPGPFTQKPTPKATTDAAKHKATRYYRIAQDEWDLKWCINNGFPFVFGFTVYESFQSGSWSSQAPYLMPMPQPSESVLGGHATLGVGYDDTLGAIQVRNSWGPGWGDSGYFWMPYSFVTNPQQAADFWTVRRES